MIDQLRIILRPVAVTLLLQSLFMLICGIMSVAFGEGSHVYSAFFKTVGVIIVFAVIIFAVSKAKAKQTITIRSGFVLVFLLWFATGIMGAMPYIISGAIPRPVDAIFESIAGFTTVGSSILSDIESLPKSILLWRALTHWLGGGGIVVLSVAILPLLGIGGTHLMQAETSGVTKEKLTPRIAQTAKYIWILYISLNISAIIFLMLGGMSLLDAFTHGSSALATGGFSNKNISVAHFSSAYIDWVLIFYMYLGSLNFLVLIKLAKGEIATFFRDTEFKVFTGIVILTSLVVSTILYINGGESYHNMDQKEYNSFLDALRFGTFQVVSIISTTGFATADYSLWPAACQILILMMFFIGGCAGSTSGGIKVIRHVIMFKQAVLNMKSLIHPKGVFTMRVNDAPISNKVIVTVLGFVIVYLMTVFVASFIVSLSGLSAFESFTGTLGCIGTVGPGFGSVGPAGNFSALPDYAKITLFITMIIGRLELFTVFLIFTPWFWKK